MKRNHTTENDALERLFAAARREEVADGDDFSQRVLSRLEPLPPSKNFYRIPTFATALASVLLWGTLMLSGVDFAQVFARPGEKISLNREKTTRSSGLRLVPRSWILPHTLTETANTL